MGPESLPVLYEDNHLYAVAKPAGLLVQADRTGDPDALTLGKADIKARYGKPGEVFLGLVHRLDRPVSGVLLFARTSKAASRLSEAFRTRRVAKRYLAVVEAPLAAPAWTPSDVGLLHGPTGTARVVAATAEGAQRASLAWRTLAAEGRRALLEVDLQTGRKHQIRAQLAALGAPVAGDLRYGARAPFADGRAIALHAACLVVPHPTRGEAVQVIAPVPSAWAGSFEVAVGEALARYSRGIENSPLNTLTPSRAENSNAPATDAATPPSVTLPSRAS